MSSALHALFLGAFLFTALSNTAVAGDTPELAITKSIEKTLVPRRPKLDGILTVRENTLYVQCINRADAQGLRCEAAGLEGEPWLHYALTVEHQEKLIALGFKPEKTFGNFVRIFPRTIRPKILAHIILGVLTEIYGAEADNVEALTDWLPAQPCHSRVMAGRDRGGSIATPHWGFAKDVAQGCQILENTEELNHDDPTAVIPGTPPEGEIDLDVRYNAAIGVQIKRLEGGQKHIWAIFEAGVPYVQCQFDKEDNAIYCEAASDDAEGAPLARILTPARRQKLIDAGFELPGKVMNFSRFYPLDRYDEAAVAHAILSVLHDGYGYGGTPALMLNTETGKRTPL